MTTSTRLLAALALCAPLAIPSSALAIATRYATSDPVAGADCLTPATACDLTIAVHGITGNFPVANQEIVVAPGNYDITTAIAIVTPGLDIHGPIGGPRPVITNTTTNINSTVFSGGPNTTLSDLDIESGGAGEALSLYSATLERVLVRGRVGGENLCNCYNGTVADSVLVAKAGSASGATMGVNSNGGTDAETLRNDTIISESAAAPAIWLVQDQPAGPQLSITATNVIARNLGGGTDVSTSPNATVTFDHSDYVTTSGTVVDGGGNVTGAPAFADASRDDFHELVGSPTIDRGIADPAIGAFDFDGVARSVGGAPDIGAFEYQPPAPPPTIGDPDPGTPNPGTADPGSPAPGGTPTPGTGTPGTPAPGTPAPTSNRPPTPTPRRSAKPRLDLRATTIAIAARDGAGRLTVACRAARGDRCAVRGALTATLAARGGSHRRKKVRIGTVSGTVAGARQGALRVVLNAAGRQALTPHGIAATLALTSQGHAGRATLTHAVRLKPAAKRPAGKRADPGA